MTMKLEKILRATQKELMGFLRKEFRTNRIYRKGKFLLVKGEAPCLLVAHLDTVHREKCQVICYSDDRNILMSPQGIGGDDRCGVFALLSVWESARKKPWLLFTCDEETGGHGAEAFCDEYASGKIPKEVAEVKCIIEIDRRGKDDAVYYSCDNKDFEDYITSKGFLTEYGSFSDISYIAPDLGIAAVNLSSGYYNAHHRSEYINLKHLHATIERVKEIVRDSVKADFPKYEYVEKVRVASKIQDNFNDWNTLYGNWKGTYGDWGRDDKYKDWYFKGEVPKDLPAKYTQMYDELLDLYSYDELEELRKYYGDDIIEEVYKEEYMPSFPEAPTNTPDDKGYKDGYREEHIVNGKVVPKKEG